jgi:hypothetical protein
MNSQTEAVIRRKILEKFLSRLKELSVNRDTDCCPELNPDIIVISNDQTVVFEAQNERASALLRQKCGWETETIRQRERICVHPCQSQRIIDELKAAGFAVAC